MNSLVNCHCCVVEIEGKGILITGAPGKGKTSLMFGLLEACRNRGLDSWAVADDQAYLNTRSGFLHASTPGSTAGLAEVRGYGIVAISHKKETTIALLVRITDDKNIERMPKSAHEMFHGVKLPIVHVPAQHENGAVRIVLAKLDLLNGNSD